jgi:hypothetical protein
VVSAGSVNGLTPFERFAFVFSIWIVFIETHDMSPSATGEDRTHDLSLKRTMLSQLSYGCSLLQCLRITKGNREPRDRFF